LSSQARSRRKSFSQIDDADLYAEFAEGSPEMEAVKDMRSDWVSEFASLGLMAAIVLASVAPLIYSTNLAEMNAADEFWAVDLKRLGGHHFFWEYALRYYP
jgi:hypothetical protein